MPAKRLRFDRQFGWRHARFHDLSARFGRIADSFQARCSRSRGRKEGATGPSGGGVALEPITESELRDALHRSPADVDAALKAVSPLGTSVGLDELGALFAPPAGPGAGPAADPVQNDGFAATLLRYLATFHLVDGFTGALRGLDAAARAAAAQANAHVPIAAGRDFFERTVWARCRIYRKNEFMGSGCVIGPSLVLTCAHVLGAADADGDYDGLEVQLESSQRVAAFPRPVASAPPSGADSINPLDIDDTVYGEDDDFAVLKMRLPLGETTAVVPLPVPPPWSPTADAGIFILHFPGGGSKGVGNALLATFARPSTRWCYRTAATLPGSSGGACFNTDGRLIGLHQGKIANGRRMVPLDRFIERIKAAVANDLAPAYVWSLSGRLAGNLVIGRDDLCNAFALMSARDAAQRGLRVRRLDPQGPVAGLGYTVEILKRLIQRRPDGHRALILSWPQATLDGFDLIGSLARQAADEKLIPAGADAAEDGAAQGQTGAATVAVSRADKVVRALHGAAEATGQIVWLIVEHPNVELGEQVMQVETLATLALRWPTLRLVLVGNETVRLPEREVRPPQRDPPPPVGGLPPPEEGPGPNVREYRLSDLAAGTAGPGLLVEYLGIFTRDDVTAFIKRAYASWAGRPPADYLIAQWSDEALDGIPRLGNDYVASGLSQVAGRLRAAMDSLEPPL